MAAIDFISKSFKSFIVVFLLPRWAGNNPKNKFLSRVQSSSFLSSPFIILVIRLVTLAKTFTRLPMRRGCFAQTAFNFGGNFFPAAPHPPKTFGEKKGKTPKRKK